MPGSETGKKGTDKNFQPGKRTREFEIMSELAGDQRGNVFLLGQIAQEVGDYFVLIRSGLVGFGVGFVWFGVCWGLGCWGFGVGPRQPAEIMRYKVKICPVSALKTTFFGGKKALLRRKMAGADLGEFGGRVFLEVGEVWVRHIRSHREPGVLQRCFRP